ncbi:hypothetical protein [Actinokineospora enzanensis]|uniref:hypothetical protein n=1 Tax=Actinokineospora enzanensis TaxID=155975 RepID=UPI000373B8FD|nr:hypothetical protein [Actinokineospora enzanensis]
MRPLRTLAGLVAAGVLTLALPGVAHAERLGTLVLTPGESVDQVPVRLTTEKGCPDGTTGYFATMAGHGLDNIVVVPAGDVLLSHQAGFMVPVADTFRDYADDNHTTLQGRYEIVLHCVDAFTEKEFGTFTANVDFPEPAHYAAVGPAKGPARNTEPIIPPELGRSVEPGAPQQPDPGAQAPQAQSVAPSTPADDSTMDTASPVPASGSGSQPFYYVAGGVVLVVLVAAGFTVARRRGAAGAAVKSESDPE